MYVKKKNGFHVQFIKIYSQYLGVHKVIKVNKMSGG